ncbi:hypothetical protein DE4576_04519 [Mycobacterium marinum]|nr:hypothetical protein [Mycobacterium marinum]RFZ63727.1 hypothetical protein DE4576_04519 [Mycobacterium marinum]
MGQGLQVVPAELAATAAQWSALSSQLVGTPPTSGQPFQATTAAMNAVNAAIDVAAAAFTARTQTTASGVTAASGGYTAQEAASAAEMGAITGVTVV